MPKPTMPVLVLAAGCVLTGCGKPAEQEPGTPADSVAAAPQISLADLEGTWTMAYSPVSGTPDVTTSQVRVTPAGWTLILPGRDSIPGEVTAGGDSVIVSVGPYESVRRPGIPITMHGVYRLDGDRLVGVVAAQYEGSRDPIVMLSEGRREPQ